MKIKQLLHAILELVSVVVVSRSMSVRSRSMSVSRSMTVAMRGRYGRTVVVADAEDSQIAVELPGRKHAAQGVFFCYWVMHSQVDVVDSMNLVVAQAQFVGHAVCHHSCLHAGIAVCICGGCEGYRHHQYQGHQLFHNRKICKV